jgi:hypothetical protein
MDFANLYKDDAQIEYYNALEDASGKTGVTIKIMQIMTSPVFNISDRYIGWFARAGLTDNYMKGKGDETKGSLKLEAGYAKPMGTDRQVRASFENAKDMSKDGGSELFLSTTGTMDHSYTWVSGAKLVIGSSSSTVHVIVDEAWGETTTVKETITESSVAFRAYSTRAIVNKLVRTVSLDYSKIGDTDPESELKLEITYFIL